MKDMVKECFYTKVENENKFEYAFNLVSENFSLKRKIDFSNFVLSIVLADDMYNPLLKDIAINIGLVKYFTDVDINDVILDEDLKLTLDGIFKFEVFQENCNLVEIIKFTIDDMEYSSLINSLDKQIEFKTGIRNTDNDISYSVCNLLNTLDEKIDSLNFEDIFDIGNKLANISDDLTVDKLVEAYKKTFIGGVFMTFKSVIELENFLKSRLEKTLKDIRFEAFKIIEGYLHDFYNEYDPFSYDRTEQLMSSLIVGDIIKTANGYSTSIYFNVDALHYPNAGISDSEIVDIVMNSSMPHGGYAKGTPIWVSSEYQLKAELIEKMRSALIANGIPIK